MSRGPGIRDNSASSEHLQHLSSSIPGRQNQRHKSRSLSRKGRQPSGGNQANQVTWANMVSHCKTFQKSSALTKGIHGSQHSDQQSEITKIKPMLGLVFSKNTALKAEPALLKGISADSTTSSFPRNLGQPANNSGQPNQVVTPAEQSPVIISEHTPTDGMDDSPPGSPPPQRKARESTPSISSQPAPSGPKTYVDEDMLGQFGDYLSKAVTNTLSAKFKATLAELAENIGSQISLIQARRTALESATPWMGRDGRTGPIKSTKPYFRPPSSKAKKKKLMTMSNFLSFANSKEIPNAQ